MSWIPMYLDERDAGALIGWLNDDPEIAFVVGAGDQRWKTVNRLDEQPDGDYQLWHMPGGPLPLLSDDPGVPDGFVADPWAGWTGRREGGRGPVYILNTVDAQSPPDLPVFASTDDPSPDLEFPPRPARPFFANSPRVIDLELRTHPLLREEAEFDPVSRSWSWRRVVDEDAIGLSCFGWIGNHYRLIGRPAHPATERWWKRLRRWVAGRSQRVARLDAPSAARAEAYAFPGAFAAIARGARRAANP